MRPSLLIDILEKDSRMQKDMKWFNEFYYQNVDKYFRFVIWNYTCTKTQAHDIVSETFVKIRNNIEKYQEWGKFESWCWTILKNCALDHLKKKTETSFSTITKNSEIEFDVEDEFDMNEFLQQNFVWEKIKKSILELDEKYREAILLRFVENMEYAQIAKVLQTSQENIRQRISRWLKLLKQNLKDLG